MNAQSTDREKTPGSTLAEPIRWLRFLSRWSLIVGLVVVVLPALYFGGAARQPSGSSLGAEYAELVQAAGSPAMYRVTWIFDALVWLMIGVTLLALAGILRRHAPIRATFIAACGIAQFTGSLAGFVRLIGTSGLAALYPTAVPARQAILLQSYLNLWPVINSFYLVATLLQGVGLLIAAWGVSSLRGFPRWLAIWLALPGLLAVLQFIIVTTGAPFSRPLNFIAVIVGTFGLNLAIAVSLWHPSTTLASAVAGEPAS